MHLFLFKDLEATLRLKAYFVTRDPARKHESTQAALERAHGSDAKDQRTLLSAGARHERAVLGSPFICF